MHPQEPLPAPHGAPATGFRQHLAEYGLDPLRRTGVSTLQINVGKRCDLA